MSLHAGANAGSTAVGTSTVFGPSASTTGAAAIWGNTTGTVLSDSRVILTSPAGTATATLTIPANVTLTGPNTSGTIAILNLAQSFTAQQTIAPATAVSPLILTGGTVTTSQPLINATQTWNTTSAAFTALLLNVTNTTSAASSLLLDLQLSSVSKLSVGETSALLIGVDAANTLALRNGVNAQTARIYATYTDASNGRWLSLGEGSDSAILVRSNGGAASGDLNFGNFTSIGNINYYTAGVLRWVMNASGHFIANADNTYDIGASGATRPRNVYVATSVQIGATPSILTGPAGATLQLGAANTASPVAQVMRSQGSRAGTDTNVGGGNFTIISGLGTGTGTPSSLILQSALSTTSGTTGQIAGTGLQILAGAAVLTSYTVTTLPTASVVGAGGAAFLTDSQTTIILGLGIAVSGGGGGSNKVPVYSDGTNWIIG